MESQAPRRSGKPPAPVTPITRGVVDHPLRKNGNSATSSGSTIRTPVSSAYAASLVESAAKSLVDTPTSTGSDDDSSLDPPSSPGLRSLLTRTLPALPDSQDRKRFIGCLAAVLASSYDYDYSSDCEDENSASVTESFAYLDQEEDDVNADSDDCNIEPSLSQSSTWDTEISQHSATPIDGSTNTPESYQDDSQYCLKKGERPTKRPARAKRTLRRKEKNADIASLARARHRQRRYEVFSNLLLSASEQLLLERSQAKAFLPMLDRLLSPNQSPPLATARKSTRGSFSQKQKQKQRLPWRRKSSRNSQSTNGSPTKVRFDETQREHPVSFASVSSAGNSDGSKSDFSPPSSVVTDSSAHSEFPNRNQEEAHKDSLTKELDTDDSLRPFLESLSPGSGFRCLALLLLQHLLNSAEGYDARVRHVLKKLGVIVLVQEMKSDAGDFLQNVDEGVTGETTWSNDDFLDAATRKFEALEHTIAWKLLHMSSSSRTKSHRPVKASGDVEGSARKRGVSREQIVRGLKIGSAGLVAGTLFAVTGGLAAPGIAAGVAAVAGSTAATAAVVTLTSSAAITAIFGVGGGGLAAYKMQRRTQGLTEFEFQKESGAERDHEGRRVKAKVEAELFSTICLSGWLRDEYDFQRPWGVTPSNPPLKDRLELLERFYAVHKPEYIPRCSTLLSKWKGQERELWQYLRETYGNDPSHLFPLDDGPRHQAALTHEQNEIVDKILSHLGFSADKDESDETQSPSPKYGKAAMGPFEEDFTNPDEKSKPRWRQRLISRSQRGEISPSRKFRTPHKTSVSGRHIATPVSDSFRRSRGDVPPTPDGASFVSSGVNSTFSSTSSTFQAKEDVKEKEKKPPKHVSTVWDYQSMYGGEHYTVKWESQLLLELSDSVEDLALDMMGGATTQILRQTAFSTLLSAVALPYALVNAANMIDGTWTLAIERSEEAGKELAKSLLFSRAGRRPVILIGFSMGARTIYSCLKELARFQEKWEEHQSDTEQDGNCSRQARKGDDAEIFERMREPASIVEDAILMGMPNHLSLSSWAACRRVVAGRLVNCYSRKDLVLSLMFQFKRLSGGLKPVCGTCPVEVHGVENLDVSDLISSHQDYCLVTEDILKRVRHGQPLRQTQTAGLQIKGNEAE